jgi:hypothetical protein
VEDFTRNEFFHDVKRTPVAQLVIETPNFFWSLQLIDAHRATGGAGFYHPGRSGGLQEFGDLVFVVEPTEVRNGNIVASSHAAHGQFISHLASCALAKTRASEMRSNLSTSTHGVFIERRDDFKIPLLMQVAYRVEHVPSLSEIFHEKDLVHKVARPRLLLEIRSRKEHGLAT